MMGMMGMGGGMNMMGMGGMNMMGGVGAAGGVGGFNNGAIVGLQGGFRQGPALPVDEGGPADAPNLQFHRLLPGNPRLGCAGHFQDSLQNRRRNHWRKTRCPRRWRCDGGLGLGLGVKIGKTKRI